MRVSGYVCLAAITMTAMMTMSSTNSTANIIASEILALTDITNEEYAFIYQGWRYGNDIAGALVGLVETD